MKRAKSPFWQKHAYRFATIGCGLFIPLTVVAMFTYPGGTFTDETTIGYDFFRNFFSDLGLVVALNGEANTVSFVLFCIALSLAGSALVFFFIAFRNFFTGDQTENLLGWLGTIAGVASGLCFIWIAFTPYDLYFELHLNLVVWTFRIFLIAVSVYAYVIFRQDVYPRRYGWIFVAFAAALAAYIALLEFGPSAETPEGLIIQATGQKIIVYISIFSVIAQSWLAYLRANGD